MEERIEIPIKISLLEPEVFTANFEDDQDLFVDFGSVTVLDRSPIYTGDYIVTPKVIEQTLATKDKKMIDDVTVLEIPFYETINVAGGNTVFIADNLEG